MKTFVVEKDEGYLAVRLNKPKFALFGETPSQARDKATRALRYYRHTKCEERSVAEMSDIERRAAGWQWSPSAGGGYWSKY